MLLKKIFGRRLTLKKVTGVYKISNSLRRNPMISVTTILGTSMRNSTARSSKDVISPYSGLLNNSEAPQEILLVKTMAIQSYLSDKQLKIGLHSMIASTVRL
jgi:hypothetical protein